MEKRFRETGLKINVNEALTRGASRGRIVSVGANVVHDARRIIAVLREIVEVTARTSFGTIRGARDGGGGKIRAKQNLRGRRRIEAQALQRVTHVIAFRLNFHGSHVSFALR